MHFVDLETSRRVQDASLMLLDACRHAATQNPDYKPGENNIDAAVSIAVQSLLMADHWTGREDRVCSIKPEEMARRIKGMSEGLGLSVGSMPGLTYLLLLGMSLDTVKKCAQERAAIRGHERDMMGGGK